MRTIALTQGKIALVDDVDYEWLLSLGSWHAVERGSIAKIYYAQCGKRCINGRRQLMHWLIGERLGIVGELDHIDRNGLNNQHLNLRGITHSENIFNGSYRVGLSGFRGVSIKRNKFEAYIHKDYRKISLGVFPSREEARDARLRAEVIYFPGIKESI